MSITQIMGSNLHTHIHETDPLLASICTTADWLTSYLSAPLQAFSVWSVHSSPLAAYPRTLDFSPQTPRDFMHHTLYLALHSNPSFNLPATPTPYNHNSQSTQHPPIMRHRLQRATLETKIWFFLLATILIIFVALAASWGDLIPSTANNQPTPPSSTYTTTSISNNIDRRSDSLEESTPIPIDESSAIDKCTFCRDHMRACTRVRLSFFSFVSVSLPLSMPLSLCEYGYK